MKYVSNCFANVRTVADFWKTVRKLLGQKEQNITVLTDDDGSLLRAPKDQAQGLSTHFQSNWNCQDQYEEHVFGNAFIEHSWYCTEDDILDIIAHIDSSAATGLDGISPKFLKACSMELAPAISALLNKCLLDGEFPDSWKHSRITAIPKVAGTSKVSEMRPISIFPSTGTMYVRIHSRFSKIKFRLLRSWFHSTQIYRPFSPPMLLMWE